MCTHYRIANAQRVLAFAGELAGRVALPDALPSEAWPEEAMPVLLRRDTPTLTLLKWGVENPFSNGRPTPVVNARDDRLKGNFWRDAAHHHRCLAPADGWFEWIGTGPKHEVSLQFRDHRPFWFAAVAKPSDAGLGTFALVTTTPNALCAALPHNRMPVILDPSAAALWLGEGPLDAARFNLLKPWPGDDLNAEALPVKRRALPASNQLDLGLS